MVGRGLACRQDISKSAGLAVSIATLKSQDTMASTPKRLRDMNLGGSHYLDVDGNWFDVEHYAEVKSQESLSVCQYVCVGR